MPPELIRLLGTVQRLQRSSWQFSYRSAGISLAMTFSDEDPLAQAHGLRGEDPAGRTMQRAPFLGVVWYRSLITGEPCFTPEEPLKAGDPVAFLQVGAIFRIVPAATAGRVGRIHAQEGSLVGFGENLFEFDEG